MARSTENQPAGLDESEDSLLRSSANALLDSNMEGERTADTPSPVQLEALRCFKVYGIHGEALGTCLFANSDDLTIVKWRIYVELLEKRSHPCRWSFDVVTHKGTWPGGQLAGDVLGPNDDRFTIVFSRNDSHWHPL